MSSLILALTVGLLSGIGMYLLLRPAIFKLLLGLVLLGHAVNLFIFSSKPVQIGSSPIGGTQDSLVDPLPQAIILTAIVIGMGIQIVLLAISSRDETQKEEIISTESSGK